MARLRNLQGQSAANENQNGSEPKLLTHLKRINSRTWDHVEYTSLPKFLHDNEFLLSGHRPELNSVVECLKTVFMVHSETGNIWTHGLGALLCVLLNIYYLANVAQDWQHGLVFSIFFIGATICMGVSATYHLFICHSEKVCKFLAKMDYCGIIVLTVTSYVPWLRFAFYDDVMVQAVYLTGMALFGALSISVVIKDEFREPRYRTARFGLFLCLGLAGFIPATHCLLYTDLLRVTGFPVWLVLTGLVYFVGGLAYATRFPESVWPGKFDIWFQSHQIMHTCVVVGVLACYKGAAQLASKRINAEADACLTDSAGCLHM